MKSASARFVDPGMERAILAFDWSSTPLGPAQRWAQSLRSIVALILASGKPMFIVWGAARTLIYNDGYVPLLDAKHPEALGKPFFAVWPDAAGSLAPLFDRLFGAAALDLDDISISFDREEAGGSPFALSYTPIREQGGLVVGVLCIHSDTSAPAPGIPPEPREHLRLAQLFELAPSYIAVLHGALHRIELANAGLLRLVGDRPVIGRTVAEVLPEAVTEGYVDLLDHAYVTGEQMVRAGVRYVAADAREHHVDFVLQPITDGTGQVTGIFVHGSDATARVLGETILTERSAQLQAKEALIQAVYEHSGEFHLVFARLPDGGFRLEEANPAVLRFRGDARDTVIGLTLDACTDSSSARRVGAHFDACFAAEAPRPFEMTYRGSIIEGVASPLPAVSGLGRQIAVSARDVTERRNLEAQLRQSQKMEAVGQLTGGLAHDFNNLLTGISGSLTLLRARLAQGRLDDLERYVTVAQSSAQRAAVLTQRLLAFARPQPLDARSVDVNELVIGMDELVRRTMGRSIEVALRLTPESWRVLVDPNQLENALLNLCINARDAMPDGGHLSIETVAECGLPCGERLSLCVGDTGTGMSPEVLGRAFEPFFTTKPVGAGTGLGLSMVYGFARQSGGTVRIDSTVGRGTIVRIDLPRHG